MRYSYPILLVFTVVSHTPASTEPPRLAVVSFAGRVIEKEEKTPVAGAKIVISRTLPGGGGQNVPEWVGESSLRTDAEGRFTIDFPPEQVAEPKLSVSIAKISHPDFVTRTGGDFALASLILARDCGDDSPFSAIAVDRAVEFRGRIVDPDGAPAVGVPFEFESSTRGIGSQPFWNDLTGKTDADGRFRLLMPASYQLQIQAKPERFLPLVHVWGADEPRAPLIKPDLGTIHLRSGSGTSGRLLGLDGKPIGGQKVTISGVIFPQRERTTRTDAQGRFTFGPLPPGNYTVGASEQSPCFEIPVQGQDPYTINRTVSPAISRESRIIEPVLIFIPKGEAPGPVELREVPSVVVEIGIVDSAGRPGQGGLVAFSGFYPRAKPTARPAGVFPDADDVERSDLDLRWACHLWPDSQGRAAFRVPKGLTFSAVEVIRPNDAIVYKTRLEPQGVWKSRPSGLLGTLDSDRKGVTLMSLRSPTAILKVVDQMGGPVQDADLIAGPSWGNDSYEFVLKQQSDGRFRGMHMFPDLEYRFWPRHPILVPHKMTRLRLREGERVEPIVVLQVRPKLPAAGDPAPGFAVKTADGRLIRLKDYRGKFLLLQFWDTYNGRCCVEQRELVDVYERFGGDPRFAMLSLNEAKDPREVAKTIQELRLAWTQASLPDGIVDPIRMSYLAIEKDCETLLIGPDGGLIARDLKGDATATAVAKALSRK
jgi:Carboxypeptidase regulatory-like domain/AhpC/TSA family